MLPADAEELEETRSSIESETSLGLAAELPLVSPMPSFASDGGDDPAWLVEATKASPGLLKESQSDSRDEEPAWLADASARVSDMHLRTDILPAMDGEPATLATAEASSESIDVESGVCQTARAPVRLRVEPRAAPSAHAVVPVSTPVRRCKVRRHCRAPNLCVCARDADVYRKLHSIAV